MKGLRIVHIYFVGVLCFAGLLWIDHALTTPDFVVDPVAVLRVALLGGGGIVTAYLWRR